MKHDNLIKKLEEMTFKESTLESHKRRLKIVLIPKSKKQTAFEKQKKIFNLNELVFKKVLALGTLVILIFVMSMSFNTLFPQPSQTVFANPIIDRALTDIAILKSQDPSSYPKLQTLEKILQEAKDSKELTYVGEEKKSDGTIFKKLRFSDEDLTQDVIIKINEGHPLNDSVDFDFKDEWHIPFDVISGAVKDGKIVDRKALTQQLRDSSLKKQWIKDLIQQRNSTCLQETPNGIAFNPTYLTTSDQKTLSKDLVPFISAAEVLIVSCQEGLLYDQNGTLNGFNLNIYSFGNQKEKMIRAQKVLDQAIQMLSQFDSIESQQKQELLKRAKRSKDLRESPWLEKSGDLQQFTFIDTDISSTAINISFNPTIFSTEAVQFRFMPDVNSEDIKKSFKTIPVNFKNSILKNEALFKDQNLQNNPHKNLILNLIIRPQNRQTIQSSFSIENVDPSVLDQLKGITESSDLLFMKFSFDNRKPLDKTHVVDFLTYSFGAS